MITRICFNFWKLIYVCANLRWQFRPPEGSDGRGVNIVGHGHNNRRTCYYGVPDRNIPNSRADIHNNLLHELA